jgi:hypothetical protein
VPRAWQASGEQLGGLTDVEPIVGRAGQALIHQVLHALADVGQGGVDHAVVAVVSDALPPARGGRDAAAAETAGMHLMHQKRGDIARDISADLSARLCVKALAGPQAHLLASEVPPPKGLAVAARLKERGGHLHAGLRVGGLGLTGASQGLPRAEEVQASGWRGI